MTTGSFLFRRRAARFVLALLVLCSLLAVVAVVFWIRGHSVGESVERTTETATAKDVHRLMLRLFGGAGRFDFIAARESWVGLGIPSSAPPARWAYSRYLVRARGPTEEPWWVRRLGVHWSRSNVLQGALSGPHVLSSTLVIGVDAWVTTLLFVALAVLLWRIRARILLAQRRAEGEQCPACGYDIRATPQRCPECGAPRPSSTWAKSRAS